MLNITIAELRNGCEAFWDYERRDAMYRVATKLVKADWPNPAEVDLASFRSREIAQFDLQGDAASVRRIFVEALNALAYTEKKIKTPVGVAKALHILAPGFFPLWDREIARACQHLWDTPAGEKSADAYLSFINLMQDTVAALEKQFAVGGPTRRGLPAAASLGDALSAHGGQSKTMLKFVDEYLYAKYTKKLLDS
jgi:hypothetical protein